MSADEKKYEYFIVALTKTGKLVSGTIVARSFSYAYDRFLDVNDLAGQVEDYRFCIRRDKTSNVADHDYGVGGAAYDGIRAEVRKPKRSS